MQNEFQTNFNLVDKRRDRQYECNKTENIMKESTMMNLTYQANTCRQHYTIPDLQNNSVFNRSPLQKRFPSPSFSSNRYTTYNPSTYNKWETTSKPTEKRTGSCLTEIWARSYISGPCLERHIAGKFFLHSRALNSDLKIPLKILGSIDVNQLFKRVTRPLQGWEK